MLSTRSDNREGQVILETRHSQRLSFETIE